MLFRAGTIDRSRKLLGALMFFTWKSNKTRDQESPFSKKRVFVQNGIYNFWTYTISGLNNRNRKLRYTHLWISLNYLKAKCKLHQVAEIKEIFFS